jgi:hypothetical protein
MLLFSVGFAWLSGQTKERFSSRLYVLISFLVILIPSILRYDVGPDYSNYVYLFKHLYEDTVSGSKELSFYLISYPFLFSAKGYIYIIGVYFFISLLLLYRFSPKGQLHYTVFFFMTLPIGYFTFDDQMRQALAMVIVMYALRYAERDNFMKYLLLTLLAAAMHYSALVVLPFYFVRKMKVELGISLIVIGLFFVLFITGITQTMMKKVYEIIPFYSHYANNNHYLTVEKISTGLGALLMLVMYTFSIVYKNKINRPVLTNFLFFGILILLFSAGNLNIARIAKYFLFVSIYTLGTVFTKSIKLDMKLAIILVMLIFFQKNLIEKVHYPAVYKSIFSNDAKIEYFEPKSKK